MAAADRLDRSRRPPVGSAPRLAVPKVVKRGLSNGLSVWVVRRPQLPMVSAILQIRVGSAMDGPRPGTAAMTAALLDDGTARRSAREFVEQVDFLGASLSAFAAEEQTLVSLLTLSRHLDSALALMGEMVAEPAFTEEEVVRERNSRLQSLRQQRDLPAVVASQVFTKVVYGDRHPYGQPPQGTEAAVETMGREHLRDFYERYYRPNNAILIVVGDVSERDLIPSLERALGGWQPRPVPEDARRAPGRPAPRTKAVYLVDKPGAAQSEIRVGHAGAARTAADYHTLQVLNMLLGGQFTSRINLNLRERRGFTYGARSSWSFRRGDGPFFASGGFFTDKTDSSVTELLRELGEIRGLRPPTAEEVEAAKNALVRSFPRRLETNDGVAGTLAELALFDLAETEIADLAKRVARVTPEEVRQAAAARIAPESLAVVIVGDLARIRDGVEALSLGPLTILDADGTERER